MEIVNEPKELKGYRVVQDGKEIFEALKKGETVMHWEAGNSMHPILMHMEYCRIRPIGKITVGIDKEFIIGKPVFCHFVYPLKEGGYEDFYMVHRCTEIIERDDELYFRIEGTDGTNFGWTKDVYGIAESTGVFQDESVLWQ
jgi:hypothetical protein